MHTLERGFKEDSNQDKLFERTKFENRRESYNRYTEWLETQNVSVMDFLLNSACYINDMQLNRMFTIYELYKMVSGIAGHIAEVGVFKGAGSMLLAKMVKLFEPEAFTCVHGFDSFTGKSSNPAESALISQNEDYIRLCELAQKQGLDGILKIHRLDVLENTAAFFDASPQLRFKLVFMDIGSYDVMKVAIPLFWRQLLPGGIMVFDHFSLKAAPGETIALAEVLPSAVVRTLPNSWTPNAYIRKE